MKRYSGLHVMEDNIDSRPHRDISTFCLDCLSDRGYGRNVTRQSWLDYGGPLGGEGGAKCGAMTGACSFLLRRARFLDLARLQGGAPPAPQLALEPRTFKQSNWSHETLLKYPAAPTEASMKTFSLSSLSGHSSFISASVAA